MKYPDYLVPPPNGLIPGDEANLYLPASIWNSDFSFGLLYRNDNDGSIVFFDGPAASIPMNNNTFGVVPGSPGISGSTGRKILNIINFNLPAPVAQNIDGSLVSGA